MGCYPSRGPRAIGPTSDSPPWSPQLLKQALSAVETSAARAPTATLEHAKDMPPAPDEAFAEQVTAWDFDVFSIPYEELPALAYSALVMHPVISAPANNIDQKKLWHYVCAVSQHYHRRPFHNFRHAVDVLRTRTAIVILPLATSSLMRCIERDHPEPFDDPTAVAALLISALVHDTDHPAIMNQFLIATEHPLAKKLAAPVAVLEHHHADVAIALLERPELNFLCQFDAGKRNHFVDLILANVLNTDVTTTMPAAKEFADSGRRPSVTVMQFNSARKEDKSVQPEQVHCMIIKAADISNPARRLPVYSRWIEGIMQEFFAQGDVERELGLPPSLNCDRTTTGVPQAQIGFIRFLVLPLFQALAGYSPAVQPFVEQAEANLKHFSTIAGIEGKPKN